MKIVICGLSITSSWGNGHATTYRALARALNARGHNIVFFERDLEWYASNRDMPGPPFCRVHIYEGWDEDVAAEGFADQRFIRVLQEILQYINRAPSVYGVTDYSSSF